MTGTLEESSYRDVCPLEVKEDAYSGLLARVRGPPDPRVTRASGSNRIGGGSKGHSESVLA
eukprot:192592-Pleurochrysis_carterae.AAC.1